MENERTENIFYLDLKHVQASMVLQNFSPIRCFLHNKWAQNTAAEEKKQKKKLKKKKSRQTHRGSRWDGMPQWQKLVNWLCWFSNMLHILTDV